MARLSKASKKNVRIIRQRLVNTGTTSVKGAKTYAQKLRKELRSAGGSRAYESGTVQNLKKLGNPALAQRIGAQFKRQDQRSIRQAANSQQQQVHPNVGGRPTRNINSGSVNHSTFKP